MVSYYNFRTGGSDEYEHAWLLDDYTDYIPQNVAAKGLYHCYISQGNDPFRAFLKTLCACVGEAMPEKKCLLEAIT